MNYWEGQDVVLTLSVAGREAFREVFDTGFVQVFVQWADETGLWVVRDRQDTGEISVMLVKWHHFESAQLDIVLATQDTPRTLGFSR